MRNILLPVIGVVYRKAVKPIFFLKDPEDVHLNAVRSGELFGSSRVGRAIFSSFFCRKYPALTQNLFDINFERPVGLAAGFDYEGRLTQILPSLGFGFGTVGTLTNNSYEGNAYPMLGRLPRSKSLMVNKGFKNSGVKATMNHLEGKTFSYPVGISIGKTNTIDIVTQEDAVADVVSAFKTAEESKIPFAYYELNISCPNLKGNIEFYEPQHLEHLVKAVEGLHLSRPVFVKMPISKTDEEIHSMMDVIVRYPYLKAVIIGNLQRDRNDPAIIPEEVVKFNKGNFSGLPCQKRSDELIKLVFKNYGSKVKVIGCGGIFNAEDAYRKITLGASLVQLITGMIFEGPELIAQINQEIPRMLMRDGYTHISEAVGSKANS